MRFFEGIIEEHNEVNFQVLACLQFLKREKIDLNAILDQLKICLRSKLSSEEKQAILTVALKQTQIADNQIEEYFLLPMELNTEMLKASLNEFLNEIPDNLDTAIITGRIGIYRNHLGAKDISSCILNSGFLISLSQSKNHERSLAINIYLKNNALPSHMVGSLHEACKANNVELVEKLIEQGAKVICLNEEGKTPLDVCLELGISHAPLARLLITKYAAAIMQKIPDLLFALNIQGEDEIIFIGSEFDQADPKIYFPNAILDSPHLFGDTPTAEMIFKSLSKDIPEETRFLMASKQETCGIFEKMKETPHQNRLRLIAKRLEECILLNPKNQKACELSKRIRFSLLPKEKALPRPLGIRDEIVSRFPLSMAEEAISESSLKNKDQYLIAIRDIYKNTLEHSIHIKLSESHMICERQISLLRERIEKLQEFIRLFEPYSVEANRKFNKKASKALFILGSLLFLCAVVGGAIPLAILGKQALSKDKDDSGLIVGFGVLLVIGGLIGLTSLCASACLPGYESCPTNPNRTKSLSKFKKLNSKFFDFIQSLPTENFLKTDTHQVEFQVLKQLREITVDLSMEEVRNRLIALKTVYDANLAELKQINLNQQVPRFEYLALGEGQYELIPNDQPVIIQMYDGNVSSEEVLYHQGIFKNTIGKGKEEEDDEEDLAEALFETPKNYDSINSDERQLLLRK